MQVKIIGVLWSTTQNQIRENFSPQLMDWEVIESLGGGTWQKETRLLRGMPLKGILDPHLFPLSASWSSCGKLLYSATHSVP